MEPDSGRPAVADTEKFAGFLHPITVVAGAFHRPRTTTVTTRRDTQPRDDTQNPR
jgi:hypothetical protein